MIGALIGDVIGSRFEFNPIFSRDFSLLGPGCDFTDDTVCTVAIAVGIYRDLDPVDTLRHWCKRYPMRGYAGMFHEWINSDSRHGYNSYGNGAVMRISPVAMFAKDLPEAEILAKQWTEITHNHPDSITSATALARMLVRLRDGGGKSVIKEEMDRVGLEIDSVENYHTLRSYEIKATKTLSRAAASVMEATSFEEAMRNVIYIGSDADTTAATAGPMAELLFGIPDKIVASTMTALNKTGYEVMKELASLYQGSLLQTPSWLEDVMTHSVYDYCATGGNDMFGGIAPSNNIGFGQISCVSQAVLQLAKPNSKTAVISIRDDGWEINAAGWGMVLDMQFFDIHDSQLSWKDDLVYDALFIPEEFRKKLSRWFGLNEQIRPIIRSDADRMARFAIQAARAGMNELVIACNFGRSRSVAVGNACMKLIGANKLVCAHEPYNQRVYEMMVEALGSVGDSDISAGSKPIPDHQPKTGV